MRASREEGGEVGFCGSGFDDGGRRELAIGVLVPALAEDFAVAPHDGHVDEFRAI
jgi:hypothetical protein